MTIAFLVQAHTDPAHVSRLVDRLKPHDVYLHVDAKTSLAPAWTGIDADLVKDRKSVHWAGFSQVEATLATIRSALDSGKSYDKFVLLSGACYPIRPVSQLAAMFGRDNDWNYIRYVPMRDSDHLSTLIDRRYFRDAILPSAMLRLPGGVFANKALSRLVEHFPPFPKRGWPLDLVPYHGSNWWALSPAAASYCLHTMESDKRIAAAYRRAFASDEQVFHTLIGNSQFATRATGVMPFTGRGTYKAANLHIIDPSLTRWYAEEDFHEIAKSDRYFVRKVSTHRSTRLLDRIDSELLQSSVYAVA